MSSEFAETLLRTAEESVNTDHCDECDNKQRGDSHTTHSSFTVTATVSDNDHSSRELLATARSDYDETLSENTESTAAVVSGTGEDASNSVSVANQPDKELDTADIEDDDENEGSFSSVGLFPFSLRKMLIQYGKEIVCLFALALTTYATLQNGPPKILRAPSPKPIFDRNSVVEEWSTGQLLSIQNKVSVSELSFVLFYAPWCAESQFAKNAYEAVANIYYKQVYFAAVNCWQPGGECRLQYAKVQSWPVLMVYYPQGVAVQYSGPWLVEPLTKFIEGLMKPYVRISNRSELHTLQVDSDSVLVGYFDSLQMKRYEFFTFVQTAIKWLEKDPYQDVRFAVVTGESYRNFNVSKTPAIRLYNWNETLDMDVTQKWSSENITRWLKDRLNFIATWIHPPGKKSATLAPFLTAGPTVLFFTPKDYYAFNKDAFHMLKQVAIEYHRSKNDTHTIDINWDLMHAIRKENFQRYRNLKITCANMTESDIKEEDTSRFKSCINDEPNITFANILNNSKFDKFTEDSDSYCYIGPQAKSSSFCRNVFFKEKLEDNIVKPKKDIPKSPLSMLRPEHDKRSALNLFEKTIRSLCKAIAKIENSVGDIYFGNEKIVNLPEFYAKSREFNKTLSFILLDSIKYKPIADRLGINISAMAKNSSLIIIDNENDSTYHMKGEITTESIMKFIKNFLSGTVKRKLRSTKRMTQPLTEKHVAIREIDSNEFREYLQFSKKTIVILFYSVQCALCSLVSQTLLVAAKIIEPIDIDFLRIDADINDFQWHFTMNAYPTLVIFPSNRTSESRVFPHSLEANVSNILGFILANLSPEERLEAIFESCKFKRISSAIQNCLDALRKEISDNISRNLRIWRHIPARRSEIVRKLQILRRVYLLSFRIDSVSDFEIIRKDFLQLKKIKEQ